MTLHSVFLNTKTIFVATSFITSTCSIRQMDIEADSDKIYAHTVVIICLCAIYITFMPSKTIENTTYVSTLLSTYTILKMCASNIFKWIRTLKIENLMKRFVYLSPKIPISFIYSPYIAFFYV